MPPPRAALLALAAAAAAQLEPLSFGAPSLVASPATTDYADAAFALDGALLLSTPGALLFSLDAGASFSRAPACALAGAPVRAGGALLFWGALAPVAGANGTAFASPAAPRVALAPSGAPACDARGAPGASFAGLPRASACGPAAAFGCPFRLAGGDVAALPSGEFVYSAIVFWGAPGAGGAVRSSLAAFASADGRNFSFRGTIADAADYPASEEGPNENALAVLADGSLACVFRTDAGDGKPGRPFARYALATSADGGRTWARGGATGAGAARPRLLHLGASAPPGARAPAPARAPVLLTGGRLRDAALGAAGWDVDAWLGPADGAASWGARASVSAAHNARAPPALAFSPALNDSAAPRQATSYTSIVALDGGGAAGGRARRLGIFYNRDLPPSPPDLFFMPFNVSW